MKPYCSQVSQSVTSALILSIGLFFLAVSARADQWGDWTYYTSDGTNVTITGYTGTNGDISIPVTISNLSVVAIGDAAFSNQASLTSVMIPVNVMSIGSNAFDSCINITNISFQWHYPWDPSIKWGDFAFARCRSLPRVFINTGTTDIGIGAFYECSSLESVTITGYATNIGDLAFAQCTNLVDVDFFSAPPPHAGASVFDGDANAIVYYWAGAKGWDTNFCGVPAMPMPFTYAYNPDFSVTITGINGTNSNVITPGMIDCQPVVSIESGAFENNTNIANVLIHSGVTNIGLWAFSGCSSITNVVIPNTVTQLDDYSFYGCGSLRTLMLPACLASLGHGAFAFSGLPSITLPASLTNLGFWAFGGGANMTNIAVEASNSCYASVDGVLVDKSRTTLLQYPSGRVGDYAISDAVTNIGPYAFSYCAYLTSVTIPSSINMISYMGFYGCSSLTNITIPSSVVVIAPQAFQKCTALKSIVIPASITNIWTDAFCYCTNLQKVYFKGDAPEADYPIFYGDDNLTVYYYPWTSGWGATFGGRPTVPLDISYTVNDGAVTISGYSGTNSSVTIPSTISNMPVVAIGDWAFDHNSYLANIIIPAGITNIGIGAFNFCTNLNTVSIPVGVILVRDLTFCACVNLTNIAIPDGVVDIGLQSFAYCSMTSISLPHSITNIGVRAFYGCACLAKVSIGDELICLDDGAFSFCSSLNTINIPLSVSSMGDWAFYACTDLEEAYFQGNAPISAGTNMFNAATNLTVYYYPWTSGWTNTFGGRPTQINPDYTQWLNNYGFTTNLTDDADKDGMLNWQEFLAHTDPTTNIDCLAVSFMDFGTNTAQISWQAKSNVSYQVMKSDDLMEVWSNAPSGIGVNQQSYQTAPMDSLMQYTDPAYEEMTNAFYRVNVVP